MALYDYKVVGAGSAGVAVARQIDQGEQPDPYHVGDYGMELVTRFCRNSRNMALYDYTVVGAGSAGVVVARRLAYAGI